MFSVFLNHIFGKIRGFPLKRKLRRAFWPQGLPKTAQGVPEASQDHPFSTWVPQMVVLFVVSKKHTKNERPFLRFVLRIPFFCYFTFHKETPRAPKEAPRGPKEHPELPRSTQEHPRSPQELPKSSQGAPKEVPKSTQELPRSTQEPSRLSLPLSLRSPQAAPQA
jgi:hypothetical protein